MRNNPIKVLYVEDDASDVDVAKLAIKDIGCESFSIHTVSDGEEAINFLTRQGPHTKADRPDLVLLDLNLPKISGRDVLKAIKSKGNLKTIPVVILSTSREQNDIDETYRLGSCGYFEKASDYDEYKQTLKLICEYWGQKVSLPSTETLG